MFFKKRNNVNQNKDEIKDLEVFYIKKYLIKGLKCFLRLVTLNLQF